MCSNLKILRIKKGLTQKQLSESSGLSVVTIKKIEDGNLNFKVKNLKKIAKALNVTVLDLLDED